MVADAVVYHPSLSHLLRFFDTTIGRDKLMRLVQYFARFYAAFLIRSADAGKIKDADKWRSLMSLFSTSRKIIRVGKPLQHLKAAATAYDNKTADAFLRYAAVGRQLCYAAYLTFDTAILAHSTKLITLRNPQLTQKLYYRLWLAGITFSVASGVYKHVGLNQREAVLANAAEKDIVAVKKVRAEKKKTSTQFALDVLDSTIPISGLALLPIDDGFVGLAGMLSSVVGAAEQWKVTA